MHVVSDLELGDAALEEHAALPRVQHAVAAADGGPLGARAVATVSVKPVARGEDLLEEVRRHALPELEREAHLDVAPVRVLRARTREDVVLSICTSRRRVISVRTSIKLNWLQILMCD